MRGLIPVILCLAFGKVLAEMAQAVGVSHSESMTLAFAVGGAFLLVMLTVSYVIIPMARAVIVLENTATNRTANIQNTMQK